MKYVLIVCITLVLLAWIGNQKKDAVLIALNTPRERCAQAMAALSQSDVDRECMPLKSDEIYAAQQLAQDINPKANIELKEVTPAAVESVQEPSISNNQEKNQPNSDPALGLSFTEVTKGFEEYGISFSSSPLVGGEPRMMGKADESKALVSLEIIGVPENISRATLIMGAVKDKEIVLGNIACMGIFINNTVPEWKSGIDWLTSSLKKLTKSKSSDTAKQEIVYDDRRITLSFVKELGLFFLSIAHKDRKS